MNFYHTKKTSLSFKEALIKTKSELVKEGFGILTEADIQMAMKEKIGVEYEGYVILGACNPKSANKALQASKEIGLLLPCNVIVYEKSGETYVSNIMPTVAMSIANVEGLSEIAKDIEEKLIRAVDSVE